MSHFDRGFSMVSVLVATAIMGVIMAGIASTFEMLSGMKIASDAQADVMAFGNDVRSILSVPALCSTNLNEMNGIGLKTAELTAASGAPMMIRLLNGDVVSEGTPIPNSKLSIFRLRLANAALVAKMH